MDREILFRGKRESDWFYGDLLTGVYTKQTAQIWYKDEDFGSVNVLVDPSTVGQYTGLTDKNGRKIFEGDIAKFKRFNDVHIGKIVFNDKTAGFEYWWNVTVGAYGEKATHCANMSVCHDIEVIGNIHDNPELIGGDTNA